MKSWFWILLELAVILFPLNSATTNLQTRKTDRERERERVGGGYIRGRWISWRSNDLALLTLVNQRQIWSSRSLSWWVRLRWVLWSCFKISWTEYTSLPLSNPSRMKSLSYSIPVWRRETRRSMVSRSLLSTKVPLAAALSWEMLVNSFFLKLWGR